MYFTLEFMKSVKRLILEDGQFNPNFKLPFFKQHNFTLYLIVRHRALPFDHEPFSRSQNIGQRLQGSRNWRGSLSPWVLEQALLPSWLRSGTN